MSTQNLSSIALDVVGQYHQAGQYLMRAYQDRVQRTARAIDERFACAVQAGAIPLVDDEAKARLVQAQQRLAGIVLNRLATDASRVAAFNDRVAGTTKNGIERIGAVRIGPAALSQAADSVAAITLPAARLALSVASAVSQGARRVGERADEIAVADAAKDVVAVHHEAEPAVVTRPKRARARRAA